MNNEFVIDGKVLRALEAEEVGGTWVVAAEWVRDAPPPDERLTEAETTELLRERLNLPGLVATHVGGCPRSLNAVNRIIDRNAGDMSRNLTLTLIELRRFGISVTLPTPHPDDDEPELMVAWMPTRREFVNVLPSEVRQARREAGGRVRGPVF